MDLGAYAQIENIRKIMVANGITVPRLRGLRLMSQEKAFSADDISEYANQLGLQAREQLELFNRYCGRSDVLYIHARIGGRNWPYYCNEVKDQPWFICRIDDAFDSTYCDIYATIKPPEESND